MINNIPANLLTPVKRNIGPKTNPLLNPQRIVEAGNNILNDIKSEPIVDTLAMPTIANQNIMKPLSYNIRPKTNPLLNPERIVEAGNEILREQGIEPKVVTPTKNTLKGLTKTQKAIATTAAAALICLATLFGIKKAQESKQQIQK